MGLFGFGSKPDHSGLLTEFLVANWRMKPRFAGAFISVDGKGASARLEDGMKRESHMESSQLRAAYLAGNDPLKFSLMAEAYNAFMNDIRHGKIANAETELAVWAILWNDSELLRQIDAALADYIVNNVDEKYPDIDLMAFQE